MNWQESAVLLGEHPTEVALSNSLLLSVGMTFAIRSIERARPLLKAQLSRVAFLQGERSRQIFSRMDEALVLLVLAFAAVMGAGSLFLHLVEALLEGTWLHTWDQTFIETVHRTVTPSEVKFFAAITPLAGRYPPYVIGFLIGVLLLRRKYYRLLVIWAGGLMGNALISEILKTYFMRARPVLENPFLVEDNFSFPSGHAMTSILLYGLLAYVCSRQFFKYQPFHRYIMVWSLSFVGVLIGTSRLVLGVHYPSDVVAGWCVSVIWLSLLILAAEASRGRFGPLDRLAFWRRRETPRVDT